MPTPIPKGVHPAHPVVGGLAVPSPRDVAAALPPPHRRSARAPPHAVAFGYVCCDAADKYVRCADRSVATLATLDCLAWQTLASVAIPGATINAVVRAARVAAARPAAVAALPAAALRWGPTAAGLGAVPLIIHPIDTMVDLAFDAARPALGLPTSNRSHAASHQDSATP